MKVISVCFVLFFIYVCQLNAHISIQIEPNEIEQISEILQGFILRQHDQQQPPTRRYRLCYMLIPFLKSISRGLTQMVAIMMTLVGANLVTSRMETTFQLNQLSVENIPQTSVSTQNEHCKNEYGCNSNLCWRACGEVDINNNTKHKLCFTARPNGTSFEACAQTLDCSPCWSCLSRCQSIYP